MVSQWNEGRVAPFIKQKDNRGNHWKGKIANGQYPQPWKHTKDWADKRSILETQFCSLIASMNVRYTLAWRRPEAMHRAVGNTNKVLFIELLTHHLKRSATLAFFDDERMGFLGIKGVFVPADSRPAFDTGLIPSVDSKRQTATLAQIKTITKIWHTAGFVERVLEGGALSYAFDQATFDRMRAQAQRAEEKRRAAKSPVNVTDHVCPAYLPSCDPLARPVNKLQPDYFGSLPADSVLSVRPTIFAPLMAYSASSLSPASTSTTRLLPLMSFVSGSPSSAEALSASAPVHIHLAPLGHAHGHISLRPHSGGSPVCLPSSSSLPPVQQWPFVSPPSPLFPAAAEPPRERIGMPALLEAAAAAGVAAAAAAEASCDGVGKRKAPTGEGEWPRRGAGSRSKAARGGEDAGFEAMPSVPTGAAARIAMAEAAAAVARAVAQAADARAATAEAEARAAEAEARAAEAEIRAAELEVLSAGWQMAKTSKAGGS
jgi:hypothetical protein